MKQVTRKEFYDEIGNMEGVTLSLVGGYPYYVKWLTRDRKIVGEIKSNYPDGIKNKYPIINTYFALI